MKFMGREWLVYMLFFKKSDYDLNGIHSFGKKSDYDISKIIKITFGGFEP